MDAKLLTDGLKFAYENNLSLSEIRMLVLFIEKPRTSKEISQITAKGLGTVQHLIQRLRFKNILILFEKDENRTCSYQINTTGLGSK